MNSSHERHVPSQEKPKSMNHTFSKITRWWNIRKTKISSRSCHHIALITSFPMSQEFCNSDSVWESYANFSEDAQTFLGKNELLLYCYKRKPQTSLHKFTSLHPSLTAFGCVYIHIKVDMFHAVRLVFKGKSGKNFNF